MEKNAQSGKGVNTTNKSHLPKPPKGSDCKRQSKGEKEKGTRKSFIIKAGDLTPDQRGDMWVHNKDTKTEGTTTKA